MPPYVEIMDGVIRHPIGAGPRASQVYGDAGKPARLGMTTEETFLMLHRPTFRDER
jgi:hypothetical protein